MAIDAIVVLSVLVTPVEMYELTAARKQCV
jgi:hypothetical protein